MNVVLKMFKLVIVALQFLTRISIFPNMAVTPQEIGRSIAFFPLIGAVMGALQYVVFLSCYQFLHLPLLVVAGLLLINEALFTGAFHWDGLADTFDGFYSTHKTKEEMLTIMKDSRIGVMGTMAIVLIAFLQYSGFYCLMETNNSDFLVACLAIYMFSKWCCAFVTVTTSYSGNRGKGMAFVEHVNWKTLLVASMVIFPLFLFYFRTLFVFFGMFFFLAVWQRYCCKKIGGITGDVLGATVKICETIVLIGFLII